MSEQDDNELPGALELALGVQEQRWPHTMDAQEWARQWMATPNHMEQAADEGAMLSWFANAIMAGFDTANVTASTRIATLEVERDDARKSRDHHASTIFIQSAQIESLRAQVAALTQDAERKALRNAVDFWDKAHSQPDDGIGTRNDALDWLLTAARAVVDAAKEG